MSRSVYERNGPRFGAGLFSVLAVAMLIAAATTIFQRPQTYRALADHGVLVLATWHCDGDDCDVTYTYAGRKHTNQYGNDLAQFSQWPPRTLVLVDPGDPATMFTVHDVQRGTNAGLGVSSVTSILLGLFFGGMAFVFFFWLRNLPDRPPPLAPPAQDASAVARALYATDRVQELLEWSRPLPGYTWYRVDGGELVAGVETMRRSIAEISGPRQQAFDAADRVMSEVRAAPRIPVIGGVRVRAYDLSDQLDQVRSGIIAAVRSGSVRSAPPPARGSSITETGLGQTEPR